MIGLAVLLVLILGCAPAGSMRYPLRMYSMTGEVLTGGYDGRGRVRVRMPGGELLEGTYVTIRDVTRQTSPSSGGGFWTGLTEGLGEPTGPSVSIEGPRFQGRATMTGNKGMVMECDYVGSSRTNRGYGICHTNTGERYSLQF